MLVIVSKFSNSIVLYQSRELDGSPSNWKFTYACTGIYPISADFKWRKIMEKEKRKRGKEKATEKKIKGKCQVTV